MAVVTQRASTADPTAGTWTNIANASDAGTSTYATWTNATRRGTATVTFGGFDWSSIPSGSQINSVTATLRHFVSSATNVETVAIAGVATTRPTAVALSTAALTATIPSTVGVVGTRANNTTSATWSVDYLEVSVDYTEVVTPDPPTNVVATVAYQEGLAQWTGEVTWTAPSGGPWDYRVYRDNVEIGVTNMSTYLDFTRLTVGETYVYAVEAYGPTGLTSTRVSAPPVTVPGVVFTPSSPADLTTCSGWYKADVLVQADGSTIGSWPDSATTGFTATQAIEAEKPIIRRGPTHALQGKPGVEFDGINDKLTTAQSATTLPVTWMGVVRPDDIALVRAMVGASAAGGLEFRHNATGRLEVLSQFTASWGVGNTPLVQGEPVMVTLVLTASSMKTWINGVADANLTWADKSFSGTGSVNLGGATTGTEWWKGLIYELVRFNQVLTTAQRLGIEKYLRARWFESPFAGFGIPL